MKWFLYAFSFIWISFGAGIIIYTRESKSMIKSLVTDLDRRFLSVLPAIFGVFLIIAATESRHSWFLRLIGILAVLKGGFIFWNPQNLYNKIVDWYLNSLSDQTFRFFGIIILILGTVILSWIL
ncbi:MAG: hypothetical protein ACWGNI_03530 [Desulfobacterales bacterium]